MKGFRLSRVFAAVTLALIGLAASPLTAPFATFSFLDALHHEICADHKTVESFKAGDENIPVVSIFDGRPDAAPAVGGALSVCSRVPETERTPHAVLRI